MINFLQHFLIVVAASYLSLVNTIGTHVENLFTDATSDEAYISLHAEPVTPASTTTPGNHTTANVLLHNKNFQRAALIASNEAPTQYTAPDVVETTELLRESLVNIFCQYKTDTFVRTTTGTGFFVSPKGIILTNAHVAQFLLLEEGASPDTNVTCVIRTGNPATPQYKAELLYISPTWIFNNASLITDAHPRGTGEQDFALLYVSSVLAGKTLPDTFPALAIDTTLLPRSTAGEGVVMGGYPAGALLRDGADAELLPVVAESTVDSLYTFGSNYADLFSVASSPVGEEGASGGPIVSADDGKAIGLIVTRGDTSEGAQSLRALTLSYVDRTIRDETGFSLAQNMQGDVVLRGDIFKDAIVPFLAQKLEGALQP